jgi:hypothetical protein
MLSLQAGVIRETLKTSKHLDFRDYYIVAPDYELTRLINTGANIADVFSDIGAYSKDLVVEKQSSATMNCLVAPPIK